MGYFQKAADVAHKGALFGLASVFCFQLYQLTTKAYKGLDSNNSRSPTYNPTTEYVQEIRQKSEEEYKNYWKTDHRDWYDKDDNSHLKNAPKPKQTK